MDTSDNNGNTANVQTSVTVTNKSEYAKKEVTDTLMKLIELVDGGSVSGVLITENADGSGVKIEVTY